MTSAVSFRSIAKIPGPDSSRSARICAAMSSTVGRPSELLRRCGGTRRSGPQLAIDGALTHSAIPKDEAIGLQRAQNAQ
jgi:hypothetical protein